MKASEYIQRLQELIAEHGDLNMYDDRGEAVWPPEFNDDDETEPCFVTP